MTAVAVEKKHNYIKAWIVCMDFLASGSIHTTCGEAVSGGYSSAVPPHGKAKYLVELCEISGLSIKFGNSAIAWLIIIVLIFAGLHHTPAAATQCLV